LELLDEKSMKGKATKILSKKTKPSILKDFLNQKIQSKSIYRKSSQSNKKKIGGS
jgi:hypothetical protein